MHSEFSTAFSKLDTDDAPASDGTIRRKTKPGSAYEQNSAVPNPLIQVMAFVVALLIFAPAHADDKASDTENDPAKPSENDFFELMIRIPSRPSRIDNGTYDKLGTLRYENISDLEVREIQRVADTLNPGAIVEIGGVTEGCPCEDGPLCTNQVWVVSHRPEQAKGFMLSRIEGHWTLGAVQKWWLEHEALLEELDRRSRQGKTQSAWYAERQSAIYLHYKSMPLCEDEHGGLD